MTLINNHLELIRGGGSDLHLRPEQDFEIAVNQRGNARSGQLQRPWYGCLDGPHDCLISVAPSDAYIHHVAAGYLGDVNCTLNSR